MGPRTRLQPLLPLLKTTNRDERQRLLQRKPVVSSFCELIKNVLKGNITLSRGQKRRWARHKRLLRSMVSRRNTYKHKTKLLQRGGFLPMLLPLAKTLLGIGGSLLL